MLPDLSWDRKTTESLHLLGLVERNDISILRGLKKKHVCWPNDMRTKFLEATVKTVSRTGEGSIEDPSALPAHVPPLSYPHSA